MDEEKDICVQCRERQKEMIDSEDPEYIKDDFNCRYCKNS